MTAVHYGSYETILAAYINDVMTGEQAVHRTGPRRVRKSGVTDVRHEDGAPAGRSGRDDQSRRGRPRAERRERRGGIPHRGLVGPGIGPPVGVTLTGTRRACTTRCAPQQTGSRPTTSVLYGKIDGFGHIVHVIGDRLVSTENDRPKRMHWHNQDLFDALKEAGIIHEDDYVRRVVIDVCVGRAVHDPRRTLR